MSLWLTFCKDTLQERWNELLIWAGLIPMQRLKFSPEIM